MAESTLPEKKNKYKLVTVKKMMDKDRNVGVLTVYYENGVKKWDFDPNPTVTFHVSKPEFIEKHGSNPFVVPVDECDEVECLDSERFDAIVDYQGTFDPEAANKNAKLLEAFRKNKKNPENFYLCPFIHGADVDITDHYIRKFNDKYITPNGGEDTSVVLNKVFWDIEDDNRRIRRFCEPTEATEPINAISCMDSRTRTLVLRFLDNTVEGEYIEYNPQIEEFKGKIEQYRAKYEKNWNAMNTKLFEGRLPPLKVEIKFYGREIDLIVDHFRDINERFNADIVMAYNMGFDWLYTINRIKNMGYDPVSVIAPKDFPDKFDNLYYINDRFCRDIKKRHDSFSIPTFYTIIDTQSSYYAIRNITPEDFTLDWLLGEVLDIHKVEHDDIEMADFPYEDYPLFCEYSGQDTLALYWLENKVKDADTLILFRGLTNTREHKVLTKTTMLRNFIEWFFITYCGLVLSNNRTRLYNKIFDKQTEAGEHPVKYPELKKFTLEDVVEPDNFIDEDYDPDKEEEEDEYLFDEEKEDESKLDEANASKKKKKFKGAFVADPKLLIARGVDILGKASNLIFDYVCDSDLSSLYPSIKIAWNLFITTMRGKLLPKSNLNDIEYSATLANHIMTRNDIQIGKKYFGLPSQTEWAEKIMKM